tara:strand:+ start:2038 stop:2229 length:192 start_codon:yes stop_codon:yes gene_type:complete
VTLGSLWAGSCLRVDVVFYEAVLCGVRDLKVLAGSCSYGVFARNYVEERDADKEYFDKKLSRD